MYFLPNHALYDLLGHTKCHWEPLLLLRLLYGRLFCRGSLGDGISAGVLTAVLLIVLFGVTAAALGRAVADYAQDLGFHKLELADGIVEDHAVAVILANHQQNTVGILGHDQSVTDFAHRRHIQNDIVIGLTQSSQHLAHLFRADQLNGVGGISAGRDYLERILFARQIAGLEDRIQSALAGQIIGQAGSLIDGQFDIQRSVYSTYMQGTSHKMPGWIIHKLESRLPGEISKISNMKMIQL